MNIVRVDYKNIQHATDFATLMTAYSTDIMGGGKPLSPTKFQDTVRALALKSYAFSFIAYVDNQAAGLVNCFESFSTFAAAPIANIHDVVVLSEFRGQKISLALLQAVENHAKENDYCKITLEVLQGNTIAKNAYQRFGFAPYELDSAMGKAEFWQKNLA